MTRGVKATLAAAKTAIPALVLLGAFAFSAAEPVVENPWGTSCNLDWCEDAGTVTDLSALEDAAALADLTAGRECWDPAEGRLPNVIAVRYTNDGSLGLIPFNDDAFAQAQAGQFDTLRACL